MTLATFWEHFNESKLTAEMAIHSPVSTITKCTLAELQPVTINYRGLLKSHLEHLALMI